MILDIENERVFLKARQPEIVLKNLPQLAEPIRYRGHNMVVDLNYDTARVLRNMGFRVPMPIRWKYDWPGRFTPLEHQIATAEFVTQYRKCFVFNEMGTMKTASVLWAADYMMREELIDRALIVGPLSTLESVWRDEVFNVAMHRRAVVLHGSAERRLQMLRSDSDFYIINYEGLDIIASKLRKRTDINLLIVDEAAAYRNGTNERYKVLHSLLTMRTDLRVWLLTGTPCPNAPTDAWALTRLVNPARVPMYFNAWKRKTMVQMSTYKWKPRIGSSELAFQAMQPAIRFRKEDCIDLPPVTYERRQSALSKEQVRAYRDMRNFLKAEAAGMPVSAVNAADKLAKLRQILCGVVRQPDTGDYLPLDHAPRLQLLLDCIEQAAAKVLVIVPFKGIVQVLHDEVKEHYSCAVVNGDVSITKRNEIFRRFKQERDPHVLLCHPKVMAHGLTLTQADMLIFYAPIYSNEQDQQVRERINRPGQTRPMTIIQIGANSLEWSIYKQVEGNRISQESILDLYLNELNLPKINTEEPT